MPKGSYKIIVHPDQDSATLDDGETLIRFGLDVLMEQQSHETEQFEQVVESVELCSYPSLPSDYNGPGFIHPLSGNSLEIISKYRVSQILEGAALKFELSEPSLVVFYVQLPEGMVASAILERVSGTLTTKANSNDLNKDDESFLR